MFTSPQIDGPAAVLHAWQRLHAATLKDASLGRWFVNDQDQATANE